MGHVSWAKGRAASLGLEFGVDIDALFQENAFQEGVFVAKHKALVGGSAVCGLKVVKVRLMDTDSLFQLLDVLCAAFTESGLCLAVSLLTLL